MSNELKLKVNLGKIGNKIKEIGINAADTALFTISHKLKKAFIKELELRKGLKIVINHYNLKKNVSVEFEVEKPPLEFAYCISGKATADVHTLENADISIDFNKLQCLIFYFPHSIGKIHINDIEALKILSFHIAPDFLNDFIDGQFDDFPSDFVEITQDNIQKSYIKSNHMTTEMVEIANQIIDCEYEGLTRKMFIESKSLELMTKHILMISKLQIPENKSLLRQDEIAIIQKIKEQIDDKISNPPSLFEIAKNAGLNHTKLNAGFKQLYDNTVFGYIRSQRLEKAKSMLISTELSISEISYQLGYSSPSHLTREFSKTFGISPKDYRKR